MYVMWASVIYLRIMCPWVTKTMQSAGNVNILYGLITFFVPIFITNSQFGTVVLKKFNLVPKFFKMYSKWSFLLNITKRH